MFELKNVQFMYNKDECTMFFKATSTSNYKQFMEFECAEGHDDVSSVYLKGNEIIICINQQRAISVDLEPRTIYNVFITPTGANDRIYYSIKRIELSEVEEDTLIDDTDDTFPLLDEYEVKQLFDNLVETIRDKLDKKIEKVRTIEEWLNNMDATVENIEVLDTFNKKFEKVF